MTAALPLRVVVSPFRAMSMKSALRDYLPALIVILSRRRRISVRIVSVRNMVKYQSAGRLPFGSQVSKEYHFDL